MLNIIIYILIIFNIFNYCLSKNIQINIAVASNFLITTEKICYFLEKKNKKIELLISSDSTANLFTKIKTNAPFDIFVSADKKHANLIEKTNLNKNKTYNYANGKITFRNNKKQIKKQYLKYIKYENFLIISNPKLSPYGKSSAELLFNIKIKHKKIILGSNINTTFSYISNNTCNIGITSISQNIQNNIRKKTYVKIPKYLYSKIKQKIIILQEKNTPLTKNILKYIKKDKIKDLIKKHGYK